MGSHKQTGIELHFPFQTILWIAVFPLAFLLWRWQEAVNEFGVSWAVKHRKDSRGGNQVKTKT